MGQHICSENTLEASAAALRPVLLFAGQGSQESGMGRDVAEARPEAMELWRHAEAESGLPLREIFWSGEEAAMSDTRALQPALTVVHLNLWQEMERRGCPVPLASAGHSLGEYAALAAAGVLTPEDAVTVTALRGKLMAEADPEGVGSMAAIVKLPTEEVEAIVREAGQDTGQSLVAANYNTPQQTVISGVKAAVAHAIAKAKSRKGRGIELKVSGAFHSPLMAAANARLIPLLDRLTWREPRFPVYANATGHAAATGAEAKRSMLQQMTSPVYWVDLLRNLYATGARWYIEVSPRATLGKMVGPSMAGLAGYCDNLRIDLMNSLHAIAQGAW